MSPRIGTIAEQEFKLICLKRSIPIYKPEIDTGVDFVIQSPSKLLKIQIKSTASHLGKRNCYKINILHGADNRGYKEGAYDFLVIYIFDISSYYIIPQKDVTSKTVRIYPNNNRAKYTKYKEAWHLFS